ncbi:MAG: hypothetical protein HY275_15025 [Gemmatimonadetes bacterium]|nr:hypothetical protein [Gemmatimonadota bacterium]
MLTTLLTAALIVGAIPAPDSACRADFAVMRAQVSGGYAGFDAKTGEAARFRELTDSVARAAAAAEAPDACTQALTAWVAFFADRHLSLTDRLAHASPDATREAPAPPRRLSVRFPDDSTAILTIPSFGANVKRVLDSLVAAEWPRLTARPYAIIDVRANGGGGVSSYAALLPLLYTAPFAPDRFETRSAEVNIAGLRAFAETPGLPAALRRAMLQLVDSMVAHPGQFVRTEPDSMLRFDGVHPLPRRVAVLVDRACVSACELFVLDARASAKVAVVGRTNTGGVLDYGNLRPVDLPSGRRRLFVPMARSRRLPARPFDVVGIAPDVLVRDPAADLVDAARAWLASPTAPPPSPPAPSRP